MLEIYRLDQGYPTLLEFVFVHSFPITHPNPNRQTGLTAELQEVTADRLALTLSEPKELPVKAGLCRVFVWTQGMLDIN